MKLRIFNLKFNKYEFSPQDFIRYIYSNKFKKVYLLSVLRKQLKILHAFFAYRNINIYLFGY